MLIPNDYIKKFLCVFLFIVSLNAAEVISDVVPSKILGFDWKIHVYLPADFQKNAEYRYPALFLLHGSGGNESDWDRMFPILDSLIAVGKIPPIVAIAPASGTSWWVDGQDCFETAFFKELFSYISKKYHLIENREAHIIAGLSMGGYGALRYGLVYPDYFGGAILLSPAIYNKLPPPESSARTSGAFGKPFSEELWTKRNFTTIIPTYLDQKDKVRFFIGAGDDDWNHEERFNYNIEQQVVHLYGLLNKKNHNPAELRIVDGGHNWNVWKPLFIEGLLYMSKTVPEFSTSR